MHPALLQDLKQFRYSHFTPELQEVSRPFAVLAESIADRAPSSQETALAIRKLLEAKDAAVSAAVRAAIDARS